MLFRSCVRGSWISPLVTSAGQYQSDITSMSSEIGAAALRRSGISRVEAMDPVAPYEPLAGPAAMAAMRSRRAVMSDERRKAAMKTIVIRRTIVGAGALSMKKLR